MKEKTRRAGPEKCQIEGCKNLANYPIYRFNEDGSKDWIYVCRKHEQEIGDSNARRANQEGVWLGGQSRGMGDFF